MSMYHYMGKVDENNKFHLLVYHSLDVAAVASIYLDEHDELLIAFSLSLNLDKPTTRALILILIACHDLGKFSTTFQSINPVVFALLHDNKNKKRRQDIPGRHDFLGSIIWKKHIYDLFNKNIKTGDDIKDAIQILIDSCTSHHGKPISNISSANKNAINAFDEDDIEVTRKFFIECQKLFLGNRQIDFTDCGEQELLTLFRRTSWWLSGLTILADWLGSNCDYFPYNTKEIPLSEYWQHTLKNAKKALAQCGLKKLPVFKNHDYRSFLNINNPRPMQEYAEKVTLDNKPQLFILEDITGSGKTEAAMMLAYRLMQKNIADGMYFALPTMATANSIHHRLSEIYKKIFETPNNASLILAHANNYLAKPFRDSLTKSPNDAELENEEQTASAYCNSWFADNRKKALLANIGVGTIDQALQAILPIRHQTLRLLGLFKKTLIVDEVHACDAYMIELLSKLIIFHTGSGGSTILLSATLPKKMREVLIDSFYSALSNPISDKAYLQQNQYPLATHCVVGTEVNVQPISSSPNLKRTVLINTTDSLNEIEQTILEKLNQGLCVCWIRNSVKDTQHAYKKLLKKYDSTKITLFHARFTMLDRYKIENKILDLFSKKSCAEQRQGQLIIATQVIEQSLDLDFDFMVTDLAPIDLIIQRMGRLQRHHRIENRPPPTLLVFSPYANPNANTEWYSTLLKASARVYQNHAQIWLTAKLLQENQQIEIPNDIRDFVEYVYDEKNIEDVPESLTKTADKVFGKEKGNRESAKMNSLKIDCGYPNSSNHCNWLEDTYTPTRLADVVTITIYLAQYKNGKLIPRYADEEFSWPMSSINIPAYLLPDEFENVPSHINLSDLNKTIWHVLLLDESNHCDLYIKRISKHTWQSSKINKIIYYNDTYGFGNISDQIE